MFNKIFTTMIKSRLMMSFLIGFFVIFMFHFLIFLIGWYWSLPSSFFYWQILKKQLHLHFLQACLLEFLFL